MYYTHSVCRLSRVSIYCLDSNFRARLYLGSPCVGVALFARGDRRGDGFWVDTSVFLIEIRLISRLNTTTTFFSQAYFSLSQYLTFFIRLWKLG